VATSIKRGGLSLHYQLQLYTVSQKTVPMLCFE